MKSQVLKSFGKIVFEVIKFVLLLGFVFYLYITLMFGPVYNTEDLIRNYENRYDAIWELREYFNSVLPKETYVSIEFRRLSTDRLYAERSSTFPQSSSSPKLYSSNTDSLLNQLNWTKETLYLLKRKLDKANCISISGQGTQVTIGWQRSFTSLLKYKIFDEDLDSRQIKVFSDSCIYQIYNSRVVLEYQSGATGSFCFPEFRKPYDLPQN